MFPSAPSASFPYRILERVGEGAMGEVFRAEDLELGRTVAIKVLKPEYVSGLGERQREEMLQRFAQEARAAAALTHPGVTVVHRVGHTGGWPYIAMEWLEGKTLQAVLAERGRLELEVVARIGLQVLSALEAAHRAGIVHRDVKPANLFVTDSRRIKLTDFGVARVKGANAAETQAGTVLGTPRYAAPEQLAGEAIDARADLYAVGAVLYECLTGLPPFTAGSTLELILKVHTAAHVPPSAHVAGVPTAFDEFIARALAKAAADRFSSARDMAGVLQSFLTPPSRRDSVERTRVRRVTPPPGPLARVSADTVATCVRALVTSWPARPLGRQPTARLLDRLVDKPLHAAAFCGAAMIGGATLLFCDGVLYAALAGESRLGDRAVEALPAQADVTLHPCPAELDSRVIPLLASTLHGGSPRLSHLDAALVDVPALAAKLEGEGFDGVLRLAAGPALAFVVFAKGKRALELFGDGWGRDPGIERWEFWLADHGAMVTIEDRADRLPTLTLRRRLADVELDVVRKAPADDGLRSDTRAGSVELLPRGTTRFDLPTCSTLAALISADACASAARWLLADAPHQFDQYGRRARWRALVEAAEEVSAVRLHPTFALPYGRPAAFGAATLDAGGRVRHVLDRLEAPTADAVTAFLERVVALRDAHEDARELTGAVLLAPAFPEAALATYLDALQASRRGFRAAIELLTHREGYLLTARDGVHVLLVEDRDGRRRPLVPQA